MRLRLILPWLSVCLCLATAALGDPAMADPKALESVYGTLSAADAVEAPRVLQDSAGFLRYLGAPPGKSFWTSAAVAKAGDPEAVAYEFLGVHGGAFAAASDCGAFRTDRVGADANRSYVRLQQVYDGLDVFGAQMIVQVNGEGGIESVLSDIMRDPGVFDSGEVTTSPGISASAAKIAAIAYVALESPTHDEADLMVTAGPDLMVYDPAVAGAKGPKRLVWKMTVSSPFDLELEKEVLVDAHTAEVVLAYSNVFTAKNREIYDANNTYDDPGELERSEGDPPSRIEDANLAYDYYGDTYDFYFNHHNRDSIDNLGMTMSATVRSCSIYYPYCPLPNAFWMPTSKRMYFGDGIVVDDVVGHELTHGVTQYESNLMYLGESGAISECFSDVWGEFVDLTNGRGDDSSSVRWLIGEELPKILNPDGRGLRNMADPTEFQNPDKMSSPYWIPPTWYWYDNGGVHSNGGVGNKMVYLLTDGDSFNGYSIAPLAQDSDESIDRVAKLMYELQTHLLGPASDYNDMYMQLSQATMNLDYTFNERMNVSAAGKAVEINPKSTTGELKRFRATPVYTVAGDPAIALTWENPQTAQFDSVSIVRSTDRFPNDPTDGTLVYEGKESLALDEDVLKGVTYYYGAFANFRTDFPQVVYARALAGTDAPSTMTEAFAVDIFGNAGGEIDFAKMIDLRYCQLTFTPVGAPSFPLGTDQDFADYTNYEATIKKGVEKLPVARTDAQGGAVSVDLANNTQIGFILDDPIPFFGKPYYQFMLAANGYVSFKGVSSTSVNNFPTLAAHYAIPRISFLFGLLSPSSGGDIWVRDLDDRVVVTFEKVPEFIELDSPISPWPTSPWPNTVQLEMFYNGQIRITYQDVMITNVICGLSDGNGVPLDLSEAFEDLAPLEETVDLSELPEVQAKLSIDPVTPVWAYAGELISFGVTTVSPNGIPVLKGQWDGPVALPFVDKQDGTGLFYWIPAVGQDGLYTMRVTATVGGETAYQDVRIHVGDPNPLPEARDVKLRSLNTIEDPTRDRLVDDLSPLVAEYTYYHPLAESDEDYKEGFPQLYWFKDNGLCPAFTNHWMVPADATKAGEVWFFTVIPRTAKGVRGPEAYSPKVTVASMPIISTVTPPNGPALGATAVVLTGERLDKPTGVTFGGIPVQRIRSISDTEIEVLTPAHAPGTVDILVTTPSGTGFSLGAYTYLANGDDVTKADINLDGVVDAQDVQLVTNAVLQRTKAAVDADANRDGAVDSLDIQAVVFYVLKK